MQSISCHFTLLGSGAGERLLTGPRWAVLRVMPSVVLRVALRVAVKSNDPPQSFPVCTNESAVNTARQFSAQRKPGGQPGTHTLAERGHGRSLSSRHPGSHGPHQSRLCAHSLAPLRPLRPAVAATTRPYGASSAWLSSLLQLHPLWTRCWERFGVCFAVSISLLPGVPLRGEKADYKYSQGGGRALSGGGQVTSRAVSGSDVMHTE